MDTTDTESIRCFYIPAVTYYLRVLQSTLKGGRGNSSEGYIQGMEIANSRVQEEIYIAPPVEHEEVYT